MAKVTLDKNGLAKSAGTLTVYNFDSVSGEFTGSSDEYLPQGVGLPANACATAPPVTDAGKVALCIDGNWQTVADHRGEMVYSVYDGAAVEIIAPGEHPAGTTPQKPATVWDKWDGAKWVTDSEAQRDALLRNAASEKLMLISEANGITQAWQTQLLLGIIAEEDKSTLTEWMKYIQAVQAVSINDAPDISWPQKPQ